MTDGGAQREPAAGLDNRHGAPEWSHDGRYIYFTVQERGSAPLYRVAVTTGSRPEPVIRERGRVGSWAIGPRGEIGYAFHTADDLPQLDHRAGQAARRLTDLNRELLAQRAVAAVEAFTFVAFDGLEVEAFLTKPHGLAEGTKHPLIVMIKGGPHGQQGPIFDARAQSVRDRRLGHAHGELSRLDRLRAGVHRRDLRRSERARSDGRAARARTPPRGGMRGSTAIASASRVAATADS